jgi:predicted amidophosphoribosyltransferase
MRATMLRELIGERCLACGVAGAALCLSCRASLHRCAEGPLPAGVSSVSAQWCYEGPARALVLALKLRGLRSAAIPLVEGMVDATRRDGLGGAVVTWVPGRRRDIAARGFDHAELLARGLARELGLRPRPLLRRRQTGQDQTSLSASDRALNVRGVFVADLAPPQVILVDDLITTGATASSSAKSLRAAGSDRVAVVVPCRA